MNSLPICQTSNTHWSNRNYILCLDVEWTVTDMNNFPHIFEMVPNLLHQTDILAQSIPVGPFHQFSSLRMTKDYFPLSHTSSSSASPKLMLISSDLLSPISGLACLFHFTNFFQLRRLWFSQITGAYRVLHTVPHNRQPTNIYTQVVRLAAKFEVISSLQFTEDILPQLNQSRQGEVRRGRPRLDRQLDCLTGWLPDDPPQVWQRFSAACCDVTWVGSGILTSSGGWDRKERGSIWEQKI